MKTMPKKNARAPRSHAAIAAKKSRISFVSACGMKRVVQMTPLTAKNFWQLPQK